MQQTPAITRREPDLNADLSQCHDQVVIGRRQLLALGAAGAGAGIIGACSPAQRHREAVPQAPPAPVSLSLAAGTVDVDLGGIIARTWAYGNEIPGKEIRLHKGQRLIAELANSLPQGVTAHWYGIATPNGMDGVPDVTQAPVLPGQKFTYDIVVPDAGTYWAHSHVGTQLARGLYLPLIVEDPEERTTYDDELVVVIDDWIDGVGTDPDKVMDKLRQSGTAPPDADGPDVNPEIPRGSPVGDVRFPYFIINGRIPTDPIVRNCRRGQRIRLRIINAGSGTAFRVAVPRATLEVIQTDGYPVFPTRVNSVTLGMGERLDAIVTVLESVPFIASAEGQGGHAQLNLRVNGAPANIDVNDFISSLRREVGLNTASLSPTPASALPDRLPDTTVEVRLDGPSDGYSWPINGKLYDPLRKDVVLKPNQRIRFRLINESMVFHAVHLHGHSFQVVGPNGPRARKDTVLVSPHQTTEIDFDSNNPGLWMLHSSNVYRREAGMAMLFEYRG